MSLPESSKENALWQGGWYHFSQHHHSPNFGPRPPGTRISLMLLHSISLPPGQYGGEEVQRLFTNQLDWNQHPYFKTIEGMEVSSHFFIRRHGELLQFVSCDDRAWHAGMSVHRGRSNCNDYSIGIELEGLEGDSFDERQYESLSALCAALLQQYPIKQVAGHEHVAPGRKGDPGKGFDWSILQQALGVSPHFFPAEILNKTDF